MKQWVLEWHACILLGGLGSSKIHRQSCLLELAVHWGIVKYMWWIYEYESAAVGASHLLWPCLGHLPSCISAQLWLSRKLFHFSFPIWAPLTRSNLQKDDITRQEPPCYYTFHSISLGIFKTSMSPTASPLPIFCHYPPALLSCYPWRPSAPSQDRRAYHHHMGSLVVSSLSSRESQELPGCPAMVCRHRKPPKQTGNALWSSQKS